MSHPDPTRPTRPTRHARHAHQPDTAAAASRAVVSQSRRALSTLVERITPWLIELGGWIFGGLIAFVLLIIPALLTIGPADAAIMVATVAFALALPLDLTGLILLRLIDDTKRIGLETEMAQAFQEAGFPVGDEVASPTAVAARQKRRTEMGLFYSMWVLNVSVLLTLIGLVAALWHMAWWVAVVFVAMLAICLAIVVAALSVLRPPDTPEARERQRRYWDDMLRQAREQAPKQAPKPDAGA